MEDKTTGWVICAVNHPNTGNSFIVTHTFSITRKKAIETFIKGSGATWAHWKRKYNFKAIKATSTITTL